MADEKFELVSSYQPTGDQPQAIEIGRASCRERVLNYVAYR